MFWPLAVFLIGVCFVSGLAILQTQTKCSLRMTAYHETPMVQDDLFYLAAIPNKALLVTATRQGQCKVWDQKTQKVVQSLTLSSAITDLNISRDGKLLVAGTDHTTILDTTTWAKRDLNNNGIGHCFVGLLPKLALIDKDNGPQYCGFGRSFQA